MPIKLKTTSESSEFTNCLVYGESGVGKTVLISTAPDPLIISAEEGMLSIADKDLPVLEIKSVKDFEEAVDWLEGSEAKGKFKTICLDSLSEIAEIVLSDNKSKNKDGRAAYGDTNDYISKYVRRLKKLPFNFYSIAKIGYIENESGVSRFMPSMPGKTLTKDIPYWFDLVLCMQIGKDKEGNDYRYLQCQPDVKYLAKDRSGKLSKKQRPNLTLLFNKMRGIEND